MRLIHKLLLLLLAVTLVPAAAVGLSAVALSDQELKRKVDELHAKGAADLSRRVGAYFDQAAERARAVVSGGDLEGLGYRELREQLVAGFRQAPSVEILAAFDASGAQLGPAIYRDADVNPAGDERRLVSGREFQGFIDSPLCGSIPERGWVFGPPSTQGNIDLCVAGDTREGGGRRKVLERLSLETLCSWFSGYRVGERGGARLLDASGQAICRGASAIESDVPILSAGAFVGSTGWRVEVGQPTADALRVTGEIWRWLLGVVLAAVFVAFLLASLWTRSITRPVDHLVHGARELARGNLGHEVPELGRDELGALTRTFNEMGRELETSRDTIEAQKDEIETWNRELQDRVERKTAELEALQEQFLEARKMAAVGELGAGVAHEINNPLTSILAGAQRLVHAEDTGRELNSERRRHYVTRIEENARKVKDIVDQLLRMSRGESDQMGAPVDLNGLVRQVGAGLEGDMGEAGVCVRTELGEAVPPIRGDAEALQRVLKALADNARTAMPDGGELSIATESSSSGVVTLRVADTGCGIEPEHHRRIFEPFFTTKSEWQGRGLGLSDAWKVVSEHHGRIEVKSEPGEGATFILSFPRAPEGTRLV